MTGMGMGGHQSHAMLSDAWLTPRHILDALGYFDLDPCAAPDCELWPTAGTHICLPNDGLAEKWKGRVWLNPPYGASTAKWLQKMSDHNHGTALIFARTETSLFTEHVWSKASALLFLAGRLYFHRSDGTRASANSGAPSVLIAYGSEDMKTLSECDLPGAFVPSWIFNKRKVSL